jgi:hypothetical protein
MKILHSGWGGGVDAELFIVKAGCTYMCHSELKAQFI